MAEHKFLATRVWHDGTSMVVANAGDTLTVPDRLIQTFIDEGVIAGKTSKQLKVETESASSAVRADGGNKGGIDDGGNSKTSLFTMTHLGGGYYAISGPGLDTPEKVKGKTEAEVRMLELETAHAQALAEAAAADGGQSGDGGAPIV